MVKLLDATDDAVYISKAFECHRQIIGLAKANSDKLELPKALAERALFCSKIGHYQEATDDIILTVKCYKDIDDLYQKGSKAASVRETIRKVCTPEILPQIEDIIMQRVHRGEIDNKVDVLLYATLHPITKYDQLIVELQAFIQDSQAKVKQCEDSIKKLQDTISNTPNVSDDLKTTLRKIASEIQELQDGQEWNKMSLLDLGERATKTEGKVTIISSKLSALATHCRNVEAQVKNNTDAIVTVVPIVIDTNLHLTTLGVAVEELQQAVNLTGESDT